MVPEIVYRVLFVLSEVRCSRDDTIELLEIPADPGRIEDVRVWNLKTWADTALEVGAAGEKMAKLRGMLGFRREFQYLNLGAVFDNDRQGLRVDGVKVGFRQIWEDRE